jgi:hypothetical protein
MRIGLLSDVPGKNQLCPWPSCVPVKPSKSSISRRSTLAVANHEANSFFVWSWTFAKSH